MYLLTVDGVEFIVTEKRDTEAARPEFVVYGYREASSSIVDQDEAIIAVYSRFE